MGIPRRVAVFKTLESPLAKWATLDGTGLSASLKSQPAPGFHPVGLPSLTPPRNLSASASERGATVVYAATTSSIRKDWVAFG